MTHADKERFKLIKRVLGPAVKIYELSIAVLSESEWAASASIAGGSDRRFRFTGGRLLDEANIGDTRA